MKTLTLLIFILFCITNINAQNLVCTGAAPNGQVQITGDDINFCNDGVHLAVNYSLAAGVGYPSTDTYTVVHNPIYNPKPWSCTNWSGLASDDSFSAAFPLPFNFCFFGNTYKQFIIGGNGQISFNVALANNSCPYILTSLGPLPKVYNGATNCIMCPYQDLDMRVLSNPLNKIDSITYGVYGVAPCRYFVISYNQIPMFQCDSLICTQQIVLYEGTNEIEINIKAKPVANCFGTPWNNGLAIEGIENATSTKAYCVPGRNNTVWTDSNSSWSFVPAGPLMSSNINSTIYWMDSATNVCLDTGVNFTYYPTQDMAVYVIIGDTTTGMGCGNVISPFKHLTVVSITPDFSFIDTSTICKGSNVSFTNLTLNATTFSWNFGDGTPLDSTQNPKHHYASLGVYSVTLTASTIGCTLSITHIINLIATPVVAKFTISSDSICSGSQLISTNNSSGTNISSLWSMGDGTTYTTQNFSHTYHTPTNRYYTIKLIVSDQFGCLDSIFKTVWVEGDPVVKIITNKNIACVYDTINLMSNLSSNTISYLWNLGDGTTSNSILNPTHIYPNAGDYVIQLTGTYLKCNSVTDVLNLHVDPYPYLNLGSPQTICPNKDFIVIKDLYNVGLPIQYLWSTGSTADSIMVNQTGNYTLTANIGNCYTTDTKLIIEDVDCIYLPNAFTPNGDGMNDYLKPKLIDEGDVSSVVFLVFNRYGQEVYRTTNIKDKGWDGTFNSKKCDVGTYEYSVKFVMKDGSSKIIKQDAILIR